MTSSSFLLTLMPESGKGGLVVSTVESDSLIDRSNRHCNRVAISAWSQLANDTLQAWLPFKLTGGEDNYIEENPKLKKKNKRLYSFSHTTSQKKSKHFTTMNRQNCKKRQANFITIAGRLYVYLLQSHTTKLKKSELYNNNRYRPTLRTLRHLNTSPVVMKTFFK